MCEEFRLGLARNPRTAGRLAVAASLSDLAAVGAEPLGLLLSVTLPARDADAVQAAVARGVAEAAAAAGTFVLGGDTNDGDDLSVGCTAAGTIPEGLVLGRLGISPGDLLFSAGPLGAGAALAASTLLAGGALVPEDAFTPPPRIAHGVALRGLASAAMDTSDGLVATLDQLARLNGLALHLTRPPGELLHPLALDTALRLCLPPLALLAAAQGEQELVFALPPSRLPDLEAVAARLVWGAGADRLRPGRERDLGGGPSLRRRSRPEPPRRLRRRPSRLHLRPRGDDEVTAPRFRTPASPRRRSPSAPFSTTPSTVFSRPRFREAANSIERFQGGPS